VANVESDLEGVLELFDFAEEAVLVGAVRAELFAQFAVFELQLDQAFVRVAFFAGAVAWFAVQLTAVFVAVQQLSG
jgi:hypothetical protein